MLCIKLFYEKQVCKCSKYILSNQHDMPNLLNQNFFFVDTCVLSVFKPFLTVTFVVATDRPSIIAAILCATCTPSTAALQKRSNSLHSNIRYEFSTS